MTELSRAEIYAFLSTTRTTGWGVVERVLNDLVQDAVDVALASDDNTAAKTQRAGGAKDLVTKFKQTVAGLPDHISETASD